MTQTNGYTHHPLLAVVPSSAHSDSTSTTSSSPNPDSINNLTTSTLQDHLATRVIHVGSSHAPGTQAVINPISLSTTYAQSSIGVHGGFEYTRSANPNRNDLEAVVASLEGAREAKVEEAGSAPVARAIALSSGSAATATVVNGVVGPGGHIISMSDVYGGTYRYLTRVAKELGMTTTLVDLSSSHPSLESDTEVVSRLLDAVTPQTRLVWIETPTNPTLRLVNIPLVVQVAHSRGIKVCVDNTFLTPYYQRPLELGADIVVHSATKYLNGHSDVLLGLAISNDESILTRLRFLQNAHGAVPGAFDCWLAQRGLKTLTLRMKQHGENALKLATWLDQVAREQHGWIDSVSYSGLPNSSTGKLAWSMIPHDTRTLLEQDGYSPTRGFPYGGMVSFKLSSRTLQERQDVDDSSRAERFLTSTRLFTLAESLGGVESLAELPSRMTHASVAKEDREKLGIDGRLIRLSVGIEDVRDLIRDVEQALEHSFQL